MSGLSKAMKLSGVVEKEMVFLLGSKHQGEKNMSFEFTFKSTKLCFLSQTHLTTGNSSYQILTFSRSFHGGEEEGFSSSLLGGKETENQRKEKERKL